MADKAMSKISSKILMDDIKSFMQGEISYEPADSTEKWIYFEGSISSTSGDIVQGSQFLGTVTSTHANDVIKWLCIKNTSTESTDGIAICTNAGTAAWNGAESMIIGSGELFTCKPTNACSLADLHGISVTMDGTYGYATGTNTSSVSYQIAAILDDVA
tara:strand:+ start:751 stop:1227 length:477 start_codon:yes stop_codon:yes gene_type:complete